MSDTTRPSSWQTARQTALQQARACQQQAASHVDAASRLIADAAYHRAVVRDHLLTPLEAAHAGVALDEVRSTARS